MTAYNVKFTVDRGGYDYEFVDPPSDMFLCKICHLPSKEPRLSVCCGHTFCNSCLDGIRQATPYSLFTTNDTCPMCRSKDFTTFPNKQNERAIKNLHVFCTNKDKGCVWQGEVNAIISHLESSDGCQFEEVKCSNDCGLLLQRQHLPSHFDNKCPCREVHCQYCNMVGQYQFIEGQHIEECPKVPLSCPNSCGVDSILRENMEEHKATCPLEEIECPEYCGKVLQRQFVTNHVETECPRRIVDCQYCQLSGEYQVIEGQHKEECPKLPIHCPNECEADDIPREDMEDHRQECPLEVIECEYYSMGCHVTMARKDQHMHEKEKMEEHLLLTKAELMDMKIDYKIKISQLESELKHYHTKRNEMETKLLENDKKINELESELRQNHGLMKVLFGGWMIQLNTKVLQLTSGDQVLPVVVKMSEYNGKKEDDDDWYSDPFYTHNGGYKIQLNVVPNGYDNVRGTHLSVYLYLMEGPYDDELSWPLTGTFKVTLLNQTGNNDHHAVTHYIKNAKRVYFSKKDIWKRSKFIRNLTLLSSKYLKDDSLFFEVSKVSSY